MAPELKDYRIKPRLASLLSTYSPGGQITIKGPRHDFKGDLIPKTGPKAKAGLSLAAKSSISTKPQPSATELRKKVSSASLKRSPPTESKSPKAQPLRPSSAVSTSAASKARSASNVRLGAKAEVGKASIRRPIRPISSPGEKPSNQLKNDVAKVESSPAQILEPPQRKPSLETGIGARRQPVIKATGVQKKTELPPKERTFVSKSGRKLSLNLPQKNLSQRVRPKSHKDQTQLNVSKREPEILTAEDLDKPMTAEELWEKIEKFSEWLAKTVNNRKDFQILNSMGMGQIRNKDRWTPEKAQDSSSDSLTDQAEAPRRRNRPKRDALPYEQGFQIRKSICSKVPGASATIGREDLLDLYPKLESHPCISNPAFFSGVKVPAGSVNGIRRLSKKDSQNRPISPSLKLPSVRGCLDEDCFKDALRKSFEIPDWAEGYFQNGDTKEPKKVGSANSTSSELGGSSETGVKPSVLSKLLSMYQNSDNSVVTDVDSDAVSVESAVYNVTPEAELDK